MVSDQIDIAVRTNRPDRLFRVRTCVSWVPAVCETASRSPVGCASCARGRERGVWLVLPHKHTHYGLVDRSPCTRDTERGAWLALTHAHVTRNYTYYGIISQRDLWHAQTCLSELLACCVVRCSRPSFFLLSSVSCGLDCFQLFCNYWRKTEGQL